MALSMKELLREFYRLIPYKNKIFTLLRLFWKPRNNVAQHFYFNGEFVTLFQGKRIRIVNYNSPNETSLFWQGTFEQEDISLKVWAEFCKDAAVILDIGANSGIFSLIAKSVNPHAQLYSFEPITRIYDRLVKNCHLNDFNVKCENFAVSNRNSDGVIYDIPVDHHYLASIDPLELTSWGEGLIEQRVQLKTILSYREENRLMRIDLVKIDVEGHEVEVIEGFGSLIKEMAPKIIVEIKTKDRAVAIEKLVAGVGYIYFSIDEKKGLHAVERIVYGDTRNYLLCMAKDVHIIEGYIVDDKIDISR